MGIMHSEMVSRLRLWMNTLKEDFYTPLGEIEWSSFTTMDELSFDDAMKGPFVPVSVGHTWGKTHEYGWFKGSITLPEGVEGERIVMNLKPDGESTLFVNGEEFGTYRAEWVREPHHYMVDNWITKDAKPGETYEVLMETYAGQFFANGDGCAVGPVLPGSYQNPKKEGERCTLGKCTYGLWNEDAYQLWMDVDTLHHLFGILDETSLRASKVADALEQFTLTVDFEQDREGRIRDYKKAREQLKPVLQMKNGSTMPTFFAVGNSHLDLAWLWPMHETYRKTARTFSAQLRLIDEYPDYIYIQSQPASYEMCRKYYPDLFEKIKKAIKKGQWIADGAMWVEPDTNMSSGEALIRQLVHGKRYYKDVLGVDSKTLWLPDTFGYTGALPQILKSADVDYLVTQKIYWSYNEGEKFPYHYFNWEGVDGTKITAFLPTSYTYFTSPTEANDVWKNRTQVRDLDGFLFPYGYGDGGGGPMRDYIEYVERQKDLEGGVKMKHTSPQQFFEEMEEEGGPKNTYRGELYFTAHRGTYTAQALIKENNRRAELLMREMEMWGSIAEEKNKIAYPFVEADRLWKEVLLHQFHDILPGSGIAEIYREAEERVGNVIKEAGETSREFASALIEKPEGKTVFNSLSFVRKAAVEMPEGTKAVITAEGKSVPVVTDGTKIVALVDVPATGAVSVQAADQEPVKAAAATVEKTADGFVMKNSLIELVVDQNGEVISFKLAGDDREFAAGKMNHFQFYKDVPRLFDAWDIDSNYIDQEIEGARNVKVSVLKESGAEAVLKLTAEIGVSSIEQEIVLKAESNRVEFKTTVDWKELHRLLKVGFPVSVYTDNVINEMQFGYVERPVHRSRLYDKDRFEVCNHRYSALADGSHGAAVLNDSKYGMSANGNRLELTLLTASACPEMRADNHVHHFTYAFTAFEGPFSESDVVRQGMELNVLPLVLDGSLESFSAFEIESDSVILDTVKPAEDGSKDLILRLYDSKKCAGKATVTWHMDAKKAALVNVLENEIEPLGIEKTEDGGKVTLDFRAFEIKSVRLHF